MPRSYCLLRPFHWWPALYRQVGEEAQSDPRGFERAVRRALERLAELEED